MKKAVAAGVNGNFKGSKVQADGRDALTINANKAPNRAQVVAIHAAVRCCSNPLLVVTSAHRSALLVFPALCPSPPISTDAYEMLAVNSR